MAKSASFLGLGLLSGYIIRLHLYTWSLLALLWFTTTRSYECVCFRFLLYLYLYLYLYLLAGWHSPRMDLYLMSSSVFETWFVH